MENLNVVNLEEVDVVFNITARTLRQKKSIILGAAKFNLIEVCNSPFLSCLQEVPVFLTGDSPIVVGIIRIQLQLGCDRIYFGKEFIGIKKTDFLRYYGKNENIFRMLAK